MPDSLNTASFERLPLDERVRLEALLIGRRQARSRIPARRDPTSYPLSFAQRRIWFLEQLAPSQSGYTISLVVRLAGALDRAALSAALDAIVARHEVLRAVFINDGAEPRQRIMPARSALTAFTDLSHLPGATAAAKADALAAEHCRTPFKLDEGPLLRMALFRCADDEHVLALAVHHIVFDGWSAQILLREIADVYAARAQGRGARLPDLPVQVADVAAWQIERQEDPEWQARLDWWATQLAGVQPLALPTDRPRPAVQTFRGAKRTRRVAAATAASFRAMLAAEGATLFIGAVALLVALLRRCTGQDDIVIGTPTAGRDRLELEPLVGPLMNTIALRIRSSGCDSFRDLLREVKRVSVASYERQDVPFERVVERVQQGRDVSRNPIFQVMCVAGQRSIASIELPGLTITPVESPLATAKTDLLLSVGDRSDAIDVTLEYNADLFEPDTIDRMLALLEIQIEAAARAPGIPVDELPSIAEADRRFIASINTTGHVYPAVCVHDLIHEQAVRTPDRIAVVDTFGGSLTYAALDRAAACLAADLQAAGVGLEAVVGIWGERTVHAVVAMLGIMKAGAAYLPLDPASPHDRLRAMCADARARIIVVPPDARGVLEDVETLRMRGLESLPDPLAPARPVTSSPENLAYVIFTSGSTGRPKGVQVTHRSLVNLLLNPWRAVRPGPDDVRLAVFPLSFDAAGLEVLGPLVVGARVVIAPREAAADARMFAALVAACHPTIVIATPSSWRLFMDADGDLSSLKAEAGGEALPRALADRMLERCGEVWNLYGPTETTVWSTGMRVQEIESLPAVVPIGHPFANTELHVVDRALLPLPLGVAGELCIGGDGVARGYAGRPDLTAERFVPDPFRSGGARMYLTGDLARWRTDGRIEFLGRRDHQLKARGVRIEAAEVEDALTAHPDVRQAVVATRPDATGAPVLAAYVVPTAGAAVDPRALRAWVRGRLPDAMVPSLVIGVEALPRTPNGKIDRAALSQIPAVARVPHVSGANARASDDLQVRLVTIWEDIFATSPIGITDDFFDLGGHSFLAVRLLARLRSDLGVDLPLAAIFGNPTVERLAAAIRERGAAPVPHSPIVRMQTHGDRPPFFCVHSVGGYVFRLHDLARRFAPDHPFYGIQATPAEELGASVPAIETLAATYVGAVRDVQPHGPYFLGGYSYGGIVAFEMAHQIVVSGEQVALLALLDGAAPGTFDRMPFNDAVLLAGFARDAARLAGIDLVLPHRAVASLDPDAGIRYILETLHRAGVAASELEPARVRRFLDGIRGRAEAALRYAPLVYNGAVTLFRSTEAEKESVEAFSGAGVDLSSPARGWDRLVAGPLTIKFIPAHHVTMVTEPHVAVLAAELKQAIDDARAHTPPQASVASALDV